MCLTGIMCKKCNRLSLKNTTKRKITRKTFTYYANFKRLNDLQKERRSYLEERQETYMLQSGELYLNILNIDKCIFSGG